MSAAFNECIQENIPIRVLKNIVSEDFIGWQTQAIVTTETKSNIISVEILDVEYWPSDVEVETVLGEQVRILGGIFIEIEEQDIYFQVIEPVFLNLQNINLAVIGWKTAGESGWISHPLSDSYFESFTY